MSTVVKVTIAKQTLNKQTNKTRLFHYTKKKQIHGKNMNENPLNSQPVEH